MTSFQILRRLTNKAAVSSLAPGRDPLTERVAFIAEQVRAGGCDPRIDSFPAAYDRGAFYVNLLVELGSSDRTRPAVVFAAHHDVNNPRSENCQDNTASVAHLIQLCGDLAADAPSKHRVIIAFLDAEETVDPVHSGAGRLADQIREGAHGPVSRVINLELTANGRRYWYEYGGGPRPPAGAFLERHVNGIYATRTPYNDAYAFRRRHLDSVCMGSVDDDNFDQIQRHGFCTTWGLCHRMEDTVERSAREEDMAAFATLIGRLARLEPG
jgi:hypothetical protein